MGTESDDHDNRIKSVDGRNHLVNAFRMIEDEDNIWLSDEVEQKRFFNSRRLFTLVDLETHDLALTLDILMRSSIKGAQTVVFLTSLKVLGYVLQQVTSFSRIIVDRQNPNFSADLDKVNEILVQFQLDQVTLSGCCSIIDCLVIFLRRDSNIRDLTLSKLCISILNSLFSDLAVIPQQTLTLCCWLLESDGRGLPYLYLRCDKDLECKVACIDLASSLIKRGSPLQIICRHVFVQRSNNAAGP